MKLKIKLTLFSLPIILCFLSGCAGTQPEINTSRKYSPEELKEDLHFLVQTYEQIHPDLYTHTSKSLIDSTSRQVQSELNSPMTSFEFYKLVAPIVSKLGDGHTNLSFPYEYRQKYLRDGGMMIPFDVRIDGDKLFVLQNYSQDSTLSPNSEILSINGIPAKEVLINLRKYKPGESTGFVDDYVQWRFKPLLWTRYGFEDNFNLKYISALNFEDYTKSFPGITSARHDSLIQKNDNNKQPFQTWTFKALDNENIAIIDMNVFGYPDLDRFNKFLDSAFTIIQHENIQNLIIDLRGNGGGDNIMGEALMDYLATEPWALSSKMTIRLSDQIKTEFFPWWLRWIPMETLIGIVSSFHTSMDFEMIETDSSDPELITLFPKQKEPLNNPLLYHGNIYVLIDHGSYSMSVMFAAIMQDYNFATLIGEETGQDANPYGFEYFFNLPNTSLKASVPSARSYRPNGKVDGRGVIPDFEVKQIPVDSENNVDTVLEFTKKLIRGKNSNVRTAH